VAKKRGSAYNKDGFTKSNKVLEQEGRVPPQAVEVEEAVLGAMLIEHGAATIALQMLKAEDFYKPANRHIYETLSNLYERDNPLDLLTVENELRDNGLLDAVGGSTYLSDLTRSVSSAANIEYHAQIITEKAIKRNLILASTDVIRESYDSASDAYDVLDEAEQKIFDLANQKSRSTAKPVADILKDTLAYLEDMRGKKYGITGVPSGLQIDQMTAGWQKGDLVIIAARPSMGKTAFVLTAARNAAMHPDENLRTPVAIFSLEMSNQSLVQRLLTMEARVRADEARKGTLNDDSFKNLIEAAGRLFTANLFIDDTPAITLMELRTKCRRLKSEHDIGMVIIDYLQLMQGSSKDAGNREQEIASISRGLKSLAKELDVPVIALSQLSRAVEQRGGDKRPQLSDLRESGSIEQDADIVIFLYRPEYYGITTTAEGQSTAGLAEVIIGKQRNGPVGSKMLYFVKDYARFENLTAADSGDTPQIGGASDDLVEANFSQTDSPIMPHNPTPDDEGAPF
jgi:replicative DNA helicase